MAEGDFSFDSVVQPIEQGIQQGYNQVQDFGSQIGQGISNAWNQGSDWVQQQAQNLGNDWNQVQNFGQQVGQNLGSDWGQVQQFGNQIGQDLSQGWNQAQQIGQQIGQGFGSEAQQFEGQIGQSLEQGWNQAQAFGNQVAQQTPGLFGGFEKGLEQGLGGIPPIIESAVRPMGEGLSTWWNGLGPSAGKIGAGFGITPEPLSLVSFMASPQASKDLKNGTTSPVTPVVPGGPTNPSIPGAVPTKWEYITSRTPVGINGAGLVSPDTGKPLAPPAVGASGSIGFLTPVYLKPAVTPDTSYKGPNADKINPILTSLANPGTYWADNPRVAQEKLDSLGYVPIPIVAPVPVMVHIPTPGEVYTPTSSQENKILRDMDLRQDTSGKWGYTNDPNKYYDQQYFLDKGYLIQVNGQVMPNTGMVNTDRGRSFVNAGYLPAMGAMGPIYVLGAGSSLNNQGIDANAFSDFASNLQKNGLQRNPQSEIANMNQDWGNRLTSVRDSSGNLMTLAQTNPAAMAPANLPSSRMYSTVYEPYTKADGTEGMRGTQVFSTAGQQFLGVDMYGQPTKFGAGMSILPNQITYGANGPIYRTEAEMGRIQAAGGDVNYLHPAISYPENIQSLIPRGSKVITDEQGNIVYAPSRGEVPLLPTTSPGNFIAPGVNSSFPYAPRSNCAICNFGQNSFVPQGWNNIPGLVGPQNPSWSAPSDNETSKLPNTKDMSFASVPSRVSNYLDSVFGTNLAGQADGANSILAVNETGQNGVSKTSRGLNKGVFSLV